MRCRPDGTESSNPEVFEVGRRDRAPYSSTRNEFRDRQSTFSLRNRGCGSSSPLVSHKSHTPELGFLLRSFRPSHELISSSPTKRVQEPTFPCCLRRSQRPLRTLPVPSRRA